MSDDRVGIDLDRFLRAASRRVESWPDWKKKLLGWNYDPPPHPPVTTQDKEAR